MSQFLEKLSETPGLITPFDKEFEEVPDYLVVRDAIGFEASEYGILAVIEGANLISTHGPGYALGRGGRPVATHAGPSPEWAQTAMSDHQSESVPEDLMIPGPVYDLLRNLSPRASVLTLDNGNQYMPSALTSNLLYARKAPSMVVVTDITQDIQSAVKFAREKEIKLTVQGGGHSYAGYALNDGGILIDMSRFNNIELNATGKIKTATIQAGCRWTDVYSHFKNKKCKQMVLGGRCQRVGVSGYILGGGISPFSRRFGLGVDSILEMKVVTAKGDIVTVSPWSTDPKHKDLFWALRGGGGGNFGILTEFTTRIHDLHQGVEVISATLTWELPRQKSDFEAMIKELNSNTWPVELTMDVIWQHKNKGKNKGKVLTGGLLVVYDGKMEDYQKAIEKLTPFICDSQVAKRDWWDVSVVEQGWYAESPAFHHHASFVFAPGSLTPTVITEIDNLMELARERLDFYKSKGKAYIIWVHIGGETAKVDARDTAFPWREAAYVSYFKLQWYEGGIVNEMIALVEEVKKKLLPYTIDGKAAYVNFVDRTIPNWQDAYYGHNYKCLQKVKKQWDPTNFFSFEQSIELPETIGTGEDSINWDKYALRHPEKLWPKGPIEVQPNPELKKEDVLRVIREELGSSS